MASNTSAQWPSLDRDDWRETVDTLHLWTQIVGKIRLACMPWINHSWHVTLYVTARGLTTSPMPHGDGVFQIDFDFVGHELIVGDCRGGERRVPLESRTTADFYRAVFAALEELGISVSIRTKPNEVDPAIPFPKDTTHATYHPEAVHDFWRALYLSDRVFHEFRARFIGKVSPSHFFWGSFDHAVTRFSGRTAPEHPGGFPNLPDSVTREAYSHEVSSAGFWPGNSTGAAFFYSYAYPSPEGFASASVAPEAAKWNSELGEFVLPYEAVRTADDPESSLMEFLESTYAAAADLGGWDRAALERRVDPRGA